MTAHFPSEVPAQPHDILDFWYADENRPAWFRSTPAFDDAIRGRFLGTWQRAADGEFDDWSATAEGSLALVIVLDQLPLNMFRNRPESFATEAAAIRVCKAAVDAGQDQALPFDRRAFLYMPLMHSEDADDQDLAVTLFAASGLQDNLRFARHHRELIRRFGRFPHRNAILGRTSTAEEAAYLASPQAFTG